MKREPVDHYSFQNLKESGMSFEQVFKHIVKFMQVQPNGNYRLMVGTDSQVHAKHTTFITGIVILNEGKGVWACIRKVVVPRKMLHLHERISYELSLSEEVVSLFTEERKNQLIDIVLPHLYKGATFTMEGHIDIGAGNKNKTSKFVNEMIARMEAMGVEPKIKPDAFVASSYANRYTKRRNG
ncbi:ribonuclease H-like YkuK family protein [Bacillus sp. AK031]